MIVVLSGPGGAGKGTIARLLVEGDPSLVLSVSWTTRSRRDDDIEEAYVFVKPEIFKKRLSEGGFLEYNEFLGHFYGTPIQDLDDNKDLLLEIDVTGGHQVLQSDPSALCVFVDAPNTELKRRLLERGDSLEHVEERLVEAERERKEAAALGYQFVINSDIEETRAVVAALIASSRN